MPLSFFVRRDVDAKASTSRFCVACLPVGRGVARLMGVALEPQAQPQRAAGVSMFLLRSRCHFARQGRNGASIVDPSLLAPVEPSSYLITIIVRRHR
jgi:hypothetical protein